MDSRRELQGPRPTPLKIRKDSYKIRKPPLAPNPSHPPPPAQQQHRAPVIIYTVSPKVIHANPADFMTLVQRLTGPGPGPGPSSSAEQSFDSGAPSPAARVAAFQKADSPRGGGGGSMRFMDDRISMEAETSGTTAQYFPSSILSPMPSSLPPISPGYFLSPSFDPSTFLMSPNNNFMASPGNKFMSSPGGASFSFTPNLPSPGALLDLFNQLKD